MLGGQTSGQLRRDTNLQGAFTFEGWVRPDGSGVARDILESSVNLALGAVGSLHARITFPGEVRVVDLRTAPLGLSGRWHHVALTRTDDRIAIYVDGTSVAEGPATPVLHRYAINMFFGGSFGPNARWPGGLDELAIYDRALNADTIRDHACVGEDGRHPSRRPPHRSARCRRRTRGRTSSRPRAGRPSAAPSTAHRWRRAPPIT